MSNVFTPEQELQIVEALFSGHKFDISTMLPSGWTTSKRIITTGSFPGPYSFDRTPYIREMLDCLAPDFVPYMGDVPATDIAIMKALQIGVTEGVIMNGIGWVIDCSPCNGLFLSGDETLSNEIVEERLDQMIDVCGLRPKIRPSVKKKRNARTGDTSSLKEYDGGRLVMGGLQNANKLRQRSIKVGWADDYEVAKSHKQAGDFDQLLRGRFAANYASMKLYRISTPELTSTSLILPAFKKGDQRYFNIPCPLCGEMIDLVFDQRNEKGKRVGIVFEHDNEYRLIDESVGYVCQTCLGFWREQEKYDAMLNGLWIPTAKPKVRGHYSYQINAFYAPAGMYDWPHYANEWIEINTPGCRFKKRKTQVFVNTVLGLTYDERSEAPKASAIARNRRSYDPGIVPMELSREDGNGDIVLLTMAADCNGTMRDLNGDYDDARLDYEVLAHSERGPTYSVDQGSIGTFGKVNARGERIPIHSRDVLTYNPMASNSVWLRLAGSVIENAWELDNGQGTMRIELSSIDIGYFTQYVMAFVQQWRKGVIGVKGADPSKFKKVYSDQAPWRPSKERSNVFILNVDVYKDDIADRMKLQHVGSGLQPMGFMNFPRRTMMKYTDSYFRQFEEEHRVAQTDEDGNELAFTWKKKSGRSQSHFFDCFGYNLFNRDLIMFQVCKAHKVPVTWANCAKILKLYMQRNRC